MRQSIITNNDGRSVVIVLLILLTGMFISAYLFLILGLPRMARNEPPEESFKGYIERNNYKWLK